MTVEVAYDQGVIGDRDNLGGNVLSILAVGGARGGVNIGELDPLVPAEFHAKRHALGGVLGSVANAFVNQRFLYVGDEAAAIQSFPIVSKYCISWDAWGWISDSQFRFLDHAHIYVLRY